MECFPLFTLFMCFIYTSCEALCKNNEEDYKAIMIGSFLKSPENDVEYKGENSFKQMLTVESNLSDNDIEHRRFARHVEVAVTESIINHIMKNLGKRYPQVKKQPKSLNRMLKNLKKSLNKYIHRRKQNQTRSIKINKNIRKKVRKNKNNEEELRRKPKRMRLFES